MPLEAPKTGFFGNFLRHPFGKPLVQLTKSASKVATLAASTLMVLLHEGGEETYESAPQQRLMGARNTQAAVMWPMKKDEGRQVELGALFSCLRAPWRCGESTAHRLPNRVHNRNRNR